MWHNINFTLKICIYIDGEVPSKENFFDAVLENTLKKTHLLWKNKGQRYA